MAMSERRDKLYTSFIYFLKEIKEFIYLLINKFIFKIYA